MILGIVKFFNFLSQKIITVLVAFPKNMIIIICSAQKHLRILPNCEKNQKLKKNAQKTQFQNVV